MVVYVTILLSRRRGVLTSCNNHEKGVGNIKESIRGCYNFTMKISIIFLFWKKDCTFFSFVVHLPVCKSVQPE